MKRIYRNTNFRIVLWIVWVLILTAVISGCRKSEPTSIGNAWRQKNVSLTERYVAPESTDPKIDSVEGKHFVVLPSDPKNRNGQLLVFFPGTGAHPDWYRSFVERAAKDGYRAISLDYENKQSVNFDICTGQPGDCAGAARLEILTGQDCPYVTPSVSKTDCAYNRLLQLLKYLNSHYPDEGWNAYFKPGIEDPGTALNWNLIAFAGHSQGGGDAAMTAKLHEIPRVIMFGSTEPAIWTEEPFATPVNRFWCLVHEKEPNFPGITRSWINIGIPGELTEVDSLPPSTLSHKLETIVEGGTGMPGSRGFYHNIYIVDGWMPPPANDGTPIMAPVWDYMLTAVDTTASTVQNQKAVKISPAGISWIDHEILDSKNKIAFQVGGSGEIRVADLDPNTGLFVNTGGEGLLIDSGATPLTTSMNGPEFGYDSYGWSVYYTKNNGGAPQPWKAIINGTDITTTPLFSGTTPRVSTLASKDSSANSINLLYGEGPTLDNSEITWTNTDNPSAETDVDSIDPGVRWIDGTQSFVYTKQTGLNAGQLAIYNTNIRAETIITDDPGKKTDSYGWIAPEYSVLLVLCIIDGSTIGIYKDNDGKYWNQIASLEAPAQAGDYKYFGSPEPFVANQKSYISCVLKPDYPATSYEDAEVWVMGINTDASNRFMLRCDDGETNTIRSDPESYVGSNQVFIYYNLINSQRQFEIWRYATDIATK